MQSSPTLRVAVAAPLPEELVERILYLEPRIDLAIDPDLLPPQRWHADFEGDPAWHRTADQQRRLDELVDSAEALYGIPDVSPAALARTVRANPRLRWVQTMAAGGGAQVRQAKLTRAELDRVTFTTTAGVHAGPLSEFALFGLFCGAKHLPRLQQLKEHREWSGRWPMRQVSEQTVLVLGMGHIGTEVARKAIALGARVIGLNREPSALPGLERTIGVHELLDVVPEVDAIVVTLPGTAATEGLLSAEVLARVKPGVTITSVGRGTVIDERALIHGLTEGRIGFAALDVFAVEPLAADNPLWSLPNVVISPHTAANSAHEERLIAELFADNARRRLDGEPMRNIVDTIEFF